MAGPGPGRRRGGTAPPAMMASARTEAVDGPAGGERIGHQRSRRVNSRPLLGAEAGDELLRDPEVALAGGRTLARHNTGNVALDITLSDALDGMTPINPLPIILTIGPSGNSLDIINITYSRPWSPGQHHNIATVTTQYAGATAQDDAYYFGIMPTIEIVKDGAWVDGNADGHPDAGELINYTFTLSNTSNVDLHIVTVTDPLLTVHGGPITLHMGETNSTTFTGSYVITQADIEAGFVYNIATADSVESPPATSEKTVLLPQYPALSIIKNGFWIDDNDDGNADPGDLLNYFFTVTNIGNVALHNVVVTDPKVVEVGGPTTLDVGEADSTTFMGSYAITQADIDAGFVYNIATADSTESPAATGEETVALPQYPLLSIVKNGVWVDGDANGKADPGELVNYTFTVTNVGNLTLHNVTVTDPKITEVGGPTTLDVGEVDSTTFTGSYSITQADIDAGFVYNIATADSTESPAATGEKTVMLPQNPLLSIVKNGAWADGNADGNADPGELINYTFVVTNLGNVTLHNVTVTDPKIIEVGGPTILAVGEADSSTFSGSYAITQEDIDAGIVYNIATADSTESGAANGEKTVTLPQYPLLSIVKNGTWVDGNADGNADPGELINYTFTLTNTGNVTLHNVTVTDIRITELGGPTTLDVGEVDFDHIYWFVCNNPGGHQRRLRIQHRHR